MTRKRQGRTITLALIKTNHVPKHKKMTNRREGREILREPQLRSSCQLELRGLRYA